MRTSWADLAAASENVAVASANSSNSALGRSTYAPPHLRNRPSTSDPIASAQSEPNFGNDRTGYGGSRWGGPSSMNENHQSNYNVGGRVCGWGNRAGGWDRGRDREVDPFGDEKDADKAFGELENTGINFDAYEDIPV